MNLIIDGANPWQQFWLVRFPLLTPSLLIAAMFRALDAFRIFDLVYVLTGGGRADSTEVLSTLTYKNLFSALLAARNEFRFALAFTSDIERQTGPVGIANFTDLHYVPWGHIAAASVVVTFPLVALVLIFQRKIISGITGGAVKE
jgi:ABC-type glycerol-3-phosphate transport system permease component